MIVLRSLRSRLIAASLLWTMGLLMLMHMMSVVMMHVFPGTLRMGIHLPVLIGVLLLAGGLFGLRGGLTPFRELRVRLSAVRTGHAQRVTGIYPTEVQPLIDDLNALLEDREKAIKRALATAGDLAHGLKTPLAILAQEADRAGTSGEPIAQQVERMRRQVDYHLARARAAASGAAPNARCPLAPAAEALIRTVLKLHANRTLDIRLEIDPTLTVRVQREDLDEILGNLLDNACKYATKQITIKSTEIETTILITVDDDGPGLPTSLRTQVLQRGIKADQAAPGSGLGLAIVRDLAELYGGQITLTTSPKNGLQARLTLPAC